MKQGGLKLPGVLFLGMSCDRRKRKYLHDAGGRSFSRHLPDAAHAGVNRREGQDPPLGQGDGYSSPRE